MTTTAAFVPVEQYLRLTEKPYFEYRDGVASQKAMPTKLHSMVQRILLSLFEKRGVEAYPELSVRVSPTKYLVPDVAVTNDFPGPCPTEPVLLCCEMVIDPVKRTAWEYHAGSEPVRVSGGLRAGQLSVRLNELFSKLPTSL